MDFTQYVFGIVDAREDVREDGGEVWCGVETGEAAGFFFSGLDQIEYFDCIYQQVVFVVWIIVDCYLLLLRIAVENDKRKREQH